MLQFHSIIPPSIMRYCVQHDNINGKTSTTHIWYTDRYQHFVTWAMSGIWTCTRYLKFPINHVNSTEVQMWFLFADNGQTRLVNRNSVHIGHLYTCSPAMHDRFAIKYPDHSQSYNYIKISISEQSVQTSGFFNFYHVQKIQLNLTNNFCNMQWQAMTELKLTLKLIFV